MEKRHVQTKEGITNYRIITSVDPNLKRNTFSKFNIEDKEIVYYSREVQKTKKQSKLLITKSFLNR